MKSIQLNDILKRTEKWFELSRGYDIFVAASQLISEYQLADAGFFVYKKRALTGLASDPIEIYRPWGDFSEYDQDMLCQYFSFEDLERWHTYTEKWILMEQIPVPHRHWQDTSFTHMGIWPFYSSGHITGALIVAKRLETPVSNKTEASEGLLSVCAFQVSNAVNATLITRKVEMVNRSLEEQIRLREVAEKELKNEAKIRLNLIDNLGVGIFLASLDRIILRANRRVTEIFGYENEELIGENFRLIYSDDESYLHFGSFYHLLTDSPEGIINQVFMFQKKNGIKFTAEVSGTLLDADDPTKGVIWVIKDISEKLALEEEIRNHHERIKGELEIAGTLQKAFLPNQLPEINGVDITWRYFPCDFLAGDMVNVMMLDQTHLGFYLLDVMGHGVSAALNAFAINYFIRPSGEALENEKILHPGKLLSHVNQKFGDFSLTESYFTMFYGVIDLTTMILSYARGGHPVPLLINKYGEIQNLRNGDMPLGIMRDIAYQDFQIQLQPGDKFILYSDGLTEMMNADHEMYTVQRVMDSMRIQNDYDIQQLVDYIIDNVREFAGKNQWKDDLTLMGIEIKN